MSGKSHPCHPEHELEQKKYKSPYTCSGCKMQGFGKRYACDHCDYVLHDDCMFPATHPIHHPFFGSSAFEFLHRPESAGPGCSDLSYRERYCDACGKPIYGFNYHCWEKGWDLHPCCRKLEDQLLVDGVRFHLRDKVSSTCHWCNQRRLRDSVSGIRGWSYVSECRKHHFHVYCVWEMVLEGWRRSETGNHRDSDALAIERIELSVLSSRSRGGRSGNKYWRMVRVFLKAIMGILVGDPSIVVASFLADLIAN